MDVRLVVVLCLWVWRSTATNQGDCYLSYNQTAVTSDEWKFGFYLEDKLQDNSSVGTIVASFQATNILSVTSFTSVFFAPVFDNSTGLLNIVLSVALDETKYTLQNEINIKVNFQCRTDTANIYINVPVEDVNEHPPTFDQSSYSYNLPMPFPSGIDIAAAFGDIYATDVDFTNTRIDYSLNGIGRQYFNASVSRFDGKKFYVMLKTTARIDVSENIVFYLTATDSGSPPLQSSVQITIIADSQYSTPTSPIFKEPIYISNVSEVNTAQKFPQDILIEDGYSTNLTIQLKDFQNGNWSSYFQVSNTGNAVTVGLVAQLPEDLLNETNALLMVQATRTGADHIGQTVLLVTGPCSSSTPDYPPAPCPGVSLHFEQDEYTVTVNKNETGIIALLRVITDHTDIVVFNITTEDETVKRIFRISSQDYQDFGLLYADEPLANPLQYEFNVTAYINSTQEHASAKVTVKVVNSSSAIETPVFTKSLEQYHIEEETTGVQIIPDVVFPTTNSSSCRFAIKNQSPSGDFFSLSESTGVVTVVNKIDREADIFANMVQAVVTLHLQIICASAVATTFLGDSTAEDLLNDPLQTTLVVYIDDINDNPPDFGAVTLTVGYPANELAARLQPKSIASVTASDKDLGVNAEIKYSLTSNVADQVVIHSSTGSIYPLEGFTYEDITFTVLAQDQNGNEGCNNATLQVQIKILGVEDVSVLWIEDAVIEDLTDVLSELKNISQYNIQVTDSAVMTDNAAQTSAVRVKRDTLNSTTTLLRLIVYALDNNGQVVAEDTLLTRLANVSRIQTATSASSLITATQEQNNTVLIVIIIILTSVLIIVLLSVTIALYLVYVRPRRVNGFSYTSQFGSEDRINKNMEPIDQSNSPMDTTENDTSITTSSVTDRQTPAPVITLTETNQSVPPAHPLSSTPAVSVPPAPVAEKKSPAPRERKRSQPVRGDLIPDPDKLVSYRKHKPKEEEDLPDPTVPGGGAPMPREPRQPGGEPVERKRSTVRFSPVIESIDK